MKKKPEKSFPTKRLRFLTRRVVSDEQRQILNDAAQVTFLPMENIGEQGELDRSLMRDLDDIGQGYTQFFDGDILVAKITPCFENGKGALVSGTLNGVGFGTTELHVLRPTEEIDARFLYYSTVSACFRGRGEAAMFGSAGQKRVPEEFVRNFRVSLPPLEQQRAIADYLDRETARLDTLVTAKERVLALLAEKRQALIVRAVTRGIDANVPIRDSGIAWLGEIPEHWAVRKIARLFREYDERGRPDLPLLEVSINRGVVIREFSDQRIESTAADFNSYKVARQGDIVFNKMRMWQGAVGMTPEDGLVSPDYVVARATGCLSSAYASLLFRTPAFSAESARNSHGIVWDRLRLYWQGFREIAVPIPHVQEQLDIVEQILSETKTLDELGTATSQTITLLHERRAALIAAAVTGRVNVERAA